MENPLNEREGLFVCESARNHATVRDRVTAWRNNVAVVPSREPPIHPSDSHRHVFSFLNDELYTPGEVLDDASTVDAHEYDRSFLLTLLGKPRYYNRKASEEQKILWRLVQHDLYIKPDNWEDFLRSKRDKMTQNHRAGRDEPTNTIYDNTASVSPSGLTTTMPSQLNPLPQHHCHGARPATSPMLRPPLLTLDAVYPGTLAPR
ncbi:hypothetical protein ARMGADRAFT_1082754 [Armillaria gallica]|uniref:Uncharacterized protein n=1 Tax=Armillaria gallica TaxID=47427 RepID=A0A2H3DSU6_ARMGA|nr:hypothetical protein ARMGADRAFT_1082754 [Armillaria gallica]